MPLDAPGCEKRDSSVAQILALSEVIHTALSALAFTNVLDMVCYLSLVQALPVIGLAKYRDSDPEICRYIVACQTGLIVLFFLVWGGYSIDSPRYLTGFDGSPFVYDKEWLFWIIGYVLNKWVYDPWPLKILSATGAALMCLAIISFQPKESRYRAVGLFVLLLVPAFYLLIGSSIRQGLAGALVVLGIVNLHQDRKMVFVILSCLAFFLHQFSIVLVAAGVLSKLNARGTRYMLVLAPFFSFVVFRLGLLLGIDIGVYVPYAGAEEGVFHWTKFFVSYALALTALLATRHVEGRNAGIVAAYAYMVACSALLLRYEVPFERLLGYSELLLPFVAIVVLKATGWGKWSLVAFWAGGLIAGVVLWSHPSIVITLGYMNA